MDVHCDLGKIIQPENRVHFFDQNEDFPESNPDKSLFSLSLSTRPNNYAHLCPPGEYELEIKFAADNFATRRKLFYINHTGNWFDDEKTMFKEGIGVSQII